MLMHGLYCCRLPALPASDIAQVQGSDDTNIKIWSTRTMLLLATLRGHEVRYMHACMHSEAVLTTLGSRAHYPP